MSALALEGLHCESIFCLVGSAKILSRNVLFFVFLYTFPSIVSNLLPREQEIKAFAVRDQHLYRVMEVPF